MTAEVQALLDADKLDEAIAAMNVEVRTHPTDIDLRARLAELLCIAGNLDRADVILDAIVDLDPGTGVGVALFRHLVRAEQARHQFYTEGRVPEFLEKPDPVSELELRACVLARAGDFGQAAVLIAQRDELRTPVAGVADGVAFDDFRDLDDLCGGHLEVVTSNGKYYWAPISRVAELELRPLERRRDTIWRRARIRMLEGTEGEVYLPCVYDAADSTPAQRLGHVTDFVGEDGPFIRALGLRSFLIGEDSRTILDLGKVTFAAPAAQG